VMEVGLKQVLHDSRNLVGSREEMREMQHDLAEAWLVIHEICTSVAGGDASLLGDAGAEDMPLQARSAAARQLAASLHAQNKHLHDRVEALTAELRLISDRSLVLEDAAHEMLVASRLEMSGKSERQALDAQVLEGDRALSQRLERFDAAVGGLELLVADLEQMRDRLVAAEAQAASRAALIDGAERRVKAAHSDLADFEKELHQALGLLALEQKAAQDGRFAVGLLEEKEAALASLAKQIQEGWYTARDVGRQREALSACTDEVLFLLRCLVDKFAHIKMAPWWPLAAGAPLAAPPASGNVTQPCDGGASKRSPMSSRYLRGFPTQSKHTSGVLAAEAATDRHEAGPDTARADGDSRPSTGEDMTGTRSLNELQAMLRALQESAVADLERFHEARRLARDLDLDLSVSLR